MKTKQSTSPLSEKSREYIETILHKLSLIGPDSTFKKNTSNILGMSNKIQGGIKL